MLGMLRLLDIVLGHEDLIHTLHRGHALGDIVTGLGELLQRVDDAVQDDQVIDERRTGDAGIVKHLYATEPQDDDDHHRAEELTHRVGHLLTDIHTHDIIAVVAVHLVETTVHLLLCVESLDDTQSAQCLFYLTHRIAPQRLGLDALLLELSTHKTHEPTKQGHEEDGKEGETPRDNHQRGEISNDQNGVLEEHVERGHDGVLYLLYITAHTGNDISLTLLTEEAQRQGGNLLI